MSTPGPKLKAHTFKLAPGERARDFRAFGDFVFIDTAAARLEISFDNVDFIPAREGRMIQTKEEFDVFYLRAAGTAVEGIAVTGRGGITSFASYGGNGGIGSSAPVALMPHDSHAALGNAPAADLPTGVYAVVITGSPPAAETWQLRAWTSASAPATDAGNGLVVPADYSTGNKRVWLCA